MEFERGRQRRIPNALAALGRAQADLIDEIVSTAARVAAARSPSGAQIYRTDALFSLLRVIEASRYSCAIADAARLLGVSRQRAHLIVHEAELGGAIGLLANPHDRRILQLELTRTGRAALAAVRAAESAWLAELLLGLDEHRLAATTHVLRTIRHRLQRNERELTGRKRRGKLTG